MQDYCAGTCAVPMSEKELSAKVAALLAKKAARGGEKTKKRKPTMCDEPDNGGCWVSSDGKTKAQCSVGKADEALGVVVVNCACRGDYFGNGITCVKKPPVPSMSRPG